MNSCKPSDSKATRYSTYTGSRTGFQYKASRSDRYVFQKHSSLSGNLIVRYRNTEAAFQPCTASNLTFQPPHPYPLDLHQLPTSKAESHHMFHGVQHVSNYVRISGAWSGSEGEVFTAWSAVQGPHTRPRPFVSGRASDRDRLGNAWRESLFGIQLETYMYYKIVIIGCYIIGCYTVGRCSVGSL